MNQADQTHFVSRAGNRPDNDAGVTEELKAAGIPTIMDLYKGSFDETMMELFKRDSGEVKTYVTGHLYGWKFTRGWRYWIAEGSGLPMDLAEELHSTHGQFVRVDGHAGAPHPRDWGKGFSIGTYHVDTHEGLKALAETIRKVKKENDRICEERGIKREYPGADQ